MSDTTSKDDEPDTLRDEIEKVLYRALAQSWDERVDSLEKLITQYGIQERIDEIDLAHKEFDGNWNHEAVEYTTERRNELTALKDKETDSAGSK